ARRALEGGGGKTQQGHPFVTPGRDIPQGLADLRQSSQVVVLPHQFLVARLVAGPSGPHDDLTQVQGTIPGEAHLKPTPCFIGEHTTPRGGCPEQITTAEGLKHLEAGTNSPWGGPTRPFTFYPEADQALKVGIGELKWIDIASGRNQFRLRSSTRYRWPNGGQDYKECEEREYSTVTK